MIARNLIWPFALWVSTATAAAAGPLVVLNYHDVVANPSGDRYAVSRASFVGHMDYLQEHGYRPISVAYLEQVVMNNAPLPDKAVLLTFDDGLKSYHDFVVPLLAIYDYPSVISLVTSWLDGIDVPPEYKGKLMSWDDVRGVARSRNVSVASHTHNMHHGIRANPQNNLRGAATTRRYFPETNSYETEVQFRERIRNDIEVSLARFKAELGIEPRAIAWPYGEYDRTDYEEARKLHMSIQFVLSDGTLAHLDNGVLGRLLVVDQPNNADFAQMIEPKALAPRRFADIRLDRFVGRSSDEQEALLSELLDRLEPLKLNSVIVTPVTQNGKRAFFQTAGADLATNILDRVVHQIRTRLNIRFIAVRIPKQIELSNSREFLADLARLTRFEGVVFESGISTAFQREAREVVPNYRVNVKFGISDDTVRAEGYDFQVISNAALSRAKDADINRLWVMLSDPGVEVVSRAAASSGREFVNYGFPFDSISKSSNSREPQERVMRKGG